jgi:colicin import membrane protein
MGRGAMFAVLAHIVLIIGLAFGVNWRSSPPTGATAELWAAVPEVAAPAAVIPPPALPPPQPKPEPKVEAPPPPKPEVRDAEIALEKAKVEKAREEREEREERERAAALERKRQQEQGEKEAREKVAQAAKEAREKEARERAEAEKLAKQREENLKRMMGQAGATGAPQATGSAQRDAGPSASYAGLIIARVRPKIVFTESVPPTIRAEVEVRAAADGTIVGKRLVKSSGSKEWDDAVLRAIDRTETLPRDTDGRVPPVITIGFTPS